MVAISLLVKDLVTALDDARGSATEYQQLIRDLWAFDQVLHDVEQLSADCGQAFQITPLCQTTKRIALQSRESINAFLVTIKRYQRSLQEGGSNSVVRDIYWKAHWKVSQKDHLFKFRTIVNGQVSLLNTILAAAMMYICELVVAIIHVKLTATVTTWYSTTCPCNGGSRTRKSGPMPILL